MKPNHTLGECPNGCEWCDPDDHLCEDCLADWTDRAYDEQRDPYYRDAATQTGMYDHD